MTGNQRLDQLGLNDKQATKEEIQAALQNSPNVLQDWWKNKSEIGKAWRGLTGQTSAEATLQANQMNIANQNYWNQVAMKREDTAHQREMADLQAAGLNPWLSVGGGGSQAASMSTAQAEPVDGSKALQATSAAALLAIVKLLSRKTERSTSSTNINYNFKR